MSARLEVALRSGDWSLDWWEGDVRGGERGDEGMLDRTLFVRPATVSGRGRLFDPSYGDRCGFLRDDVGCSLSEAARPYGCLDLMPVQGGNCLRSEGEKKSSDIFLWVSFQDFLEEVGKKLRRELG